MTKDSCEYFFCKARWWLEIISYSIKAATVDHDKDCHYHLHRNRHHHHHGHRQCWCQVAELKEIMTKMGERFTETQVREMVSLIFHYYHHHHHHHHGYPANSIKLCLCSWRIWPQWSKSMQVEVADVEGKGVIDYEAFASLLTAHRNWLNIKPFFFSDVFRCNLISITFPCICQLADLSKSASLHMSLSLKPEQLQLLGRGSKYEDGWMIEGWSQPLANKLMIINQSIIDFGDWIWMGETAFFVFSNGHREDINEEKKTFSFGHCPKENVFFCWCLPLIDIF